MMWKSLEKIHGRDWIAARRKDERKQREPKWKQRNPIRDLSQIIGEPNSCSARKKRPISHSRPCSSHFRRVAFLRFFCDHFFPRRRILVRSHLSAFPSHLKMKHGKSRLITVNHGKSRWIKGGAVFLRCWMFDVPLSLACPPLPTGFPAAAHVICRDYV